MKRRDLVVIVAIAFASGVFSYVLANLFFGGEKAYKLTSPKVDAISADFKQPNQKYFNSQSVDITQLIQIGGSTSNKTL